MDTHSVIKNQFSISQFGEYYLPSVNRNTFEKIDSKTLYKQKYSRDIFKEDTLHIIFGLDSGLLVNYILENDRPSGSKYIFVELPVVLSLLNVDIPKNKSSYIKIFNLEQLSEHLESSQDDLFLIKNQSIITLSLAVSSGIIEEYIEFFNTAHRIISQHTSLQKSCFTQKIFVTQQLKNVCDNHIPASILNNKFTGKMAIIVGGGPSFDNHIAWIKNNYQDLFIIAVSRMAAILSKAGIPAHIIVSVDPQEHSFEVNRDMMSLSKESLFITSHHVNHRIVSQWQGTSLYIGEALPWVNEPNNIPTIGPTVTNSALRIAIEYGFKNILLSGVDFCHSNNGITHAQGTVEAQAGTSNSAINEWVETYAGEIAETPIQLVYAAQALQEEAQSYPDVTISNLSINAAQVDGIDYQPIDSVKIIPANINPQQLLALVDELSSSQAEFFVKKHDELSSALTDFKRINCLCIKAIELNSELVSNRKTPKKHQKINAKIESIENTLKNNFAEYTNAIKFYGYYEFSKFLTTKDTEDWTVDQMNDMTYQYYNAFKVISSTLIGSIAESIDYVELRLEELKETASISLLHKGWLKYNQPGRVNIWLASQTEESKISYSKEDTHLIEALQENYHQQLTSLSHPYFSMQKSNQSLVNTQTKILDLQKNNNATGLRILLKGLEPLMKENETADRLFHLAEHYLYIIEKRFELALESVQKIADVQLTEIERKQILFLSLKLYDLDLAEKTLSELTQYSDEYLPQHAHILSLQGNNQQALDMYLDFLDKYPTDESTLIKLGIFLAGLGEINGAKSAFEQILSFNPDNLTASNYLTQLA
ncbi:DUF115 domain-containing protein [Shewanella sp. 3_MG-2023]|uniref:6-hydroxymethylpterin diphosphokinase MptE-like protein n=1 Tax=Shewanella sp. 3_MG-2023 TaxID=3062635 RepID=UPI0026E2D891|nr:6-hydroxymethylpterin diphosphokinase MptE-like protein [Shewanella sp. 3_MG-2023]MDO6774769.1 DUF115 domain-containing protein [Shewanella sp. 3_MG-2023]